MGKLVLQHSFLGGPTQAKKGGRTFQGSHWGLGQNKDWNSRLLLPAQSCSPPHSKGSQYYKILPQQDS